MKKFLLLLVVAAALWFFRDAPLLREAWGTVQSQIAKFRPPTPPASSNGAKSSEGLPPVPVTAVLVENKDVPIYLNGLGTVQGFNTVTVRPRVDGQLDAVHFTEGMDVKAGQLLAQIDPRPLQAALDQAVARRKQDEAQLLNARRDLERDLALLADKAGTAQKADTQKALVEQFEATLHADDAAIEAASVQLSYASILSPISGRAGLRLVDEGNVVRAQDATGLVVITQLQPVSVVFTLPEQQLEAIRTESQQSSLQVLAVARDNKTTIADGSLAVIDNQIDSSTGTIRLKATFPNADLKLWPGQFVNVRLRVAVRKAAIAVPVQAVQYGPSGAFLFVLNAENEAEMRPLKVGRIEEGTALVDSGLQPGERVVVDGQFRLQPGAKVRLIEHGGKRSGKEAASAPQNSEPKTQSDESRPLAERPHTPASSREALDASAGSSKRQP